MHHYLQFDSVHFAYPDGHEALRGVSFHLTHGEHVALAGANGAGKSTLLMQTNGLLMPSKGSIDVGGITLSAQSLNTIRQRVGFIFQDADNQLFMPTVEEDIAFGPSLMPLSASEVASRVDKALQAVGCEHLRHREPHTLSGGEKRRIAIATVLAMTPSILVLDEPTIGLDPKARRELINLLRDFSHTILIATHDMELIAELCPRTIVLKEGMIVADMATDAIFADVALMEECGLEQPLSVRLKALSQMIPTVDNP
ncbi:MAG: ABC transporter ATP-binding protein [Alistipes sp.]|nr:ABC transporter ATP-binding protein [Alistipes sp.]